RGEGTGLIAMVLIPAALIQQDATRTPLPQRPAFGGGSTSVPHQPQVPVQNGFRSFGSLDSFDSGSARPPAGPFGADTDAPRHPSFDSGTYPSYPSPAPGRPQGFAPGSYPSAPPAQERPGSYPPFPGTGSDLPRREPRRGDFPSPNGLGTPGPGPGPGTSGTSGTDFPSTDFPSTDLPRRGAAPSAGGYSTNDVRRPDTPPSVEVSPMEAEQEEYLPIFASVESAWFRRPAA